MARRHDKLIPLTHDHHHALKQARELGVAADSGSSDAVVAAAASFVDFYDRDLLTHFREEEEQLLPLLDPDDDEARALVTRTLLEHVDLHRLAGTLRHGVGAGEPQPQSLHDISVLLRAHVRMEEDRLFPMIEQRVPESALSEVHLAPRLRSTPVPSSET